MHFIFLDHDLTGSVSLRIGVASILPQKVTLKSLAFCDQPCKTPCDVQGKLRWPNFNPSISTKRKLGGGNDRIWNRATISIDSKTTKKSSSWGVTPSLEWSQDNIHKIVQWFRRSVGGWVILYIFFEWHESNIITCWAFSNWSWQQEWHLSASECLCQNDIPLKA